MTLRQVALKKYGVMIWVLGAQNVVQ